MKNTLNPQRLQKQIESIQRQLAQLGSMRPGCLALRYKKPKLKQGPYYQLSYTHRMQHKTECVRPDLVPQIQQELAEYRRYRRLNQQWVELSLQLSRLKMQAAKPNQPTA